MKFQWFANIPAEIRINIYTELFASTNVVYEFDRFTYGNENEESRKSPVNLLLSAKRVKEEAEPIFWQSATFYYGFDHAIPSAHHIRHIQSLNVVGDLTASDIAELTTFLLRCPEDGVDKHVERYVIERYLDTTHELNTIDHILYMSKKQVSYLQLNLNFDVEFDIISNEREDEGLDYEMPEDPECTLKIRDTYNISINREEEEFLRALERILSRSHSKTFRKLRLSVEIEGEEARPLLLTRPTTV